MFYWPANYQMKAKDDKCHLILSSPEEVTAIQIEESTIKCLKVKKILGKHTGYKLKFDTLRHIQVTHIHFEIICEKTHRKLKALSRIENYMELPKKRIL